MAPTVISSLGHGDRLPGGGFDLSTVGLQHGDMVVGFAFTFGNAFLGDSLTDYLGFQIGFTGGADSQKSGPGSDRALELTTWPTVHSFNDASLWSTSCLYNSAGSDTLNVAWAVTPISLGSEDILTNIVIVRGANSAYHTTTAGFQAPVGFDNTNLIPYVHPVFGAESGIDSDGVWLEGLGAIVFQEDAEVGFIAYDHVDLSDLHAEPLGGSVVPAASGFLGCDMPVAETGTGLTQPSGDWELDNNDGTFCFFGASIHVQCYLDPDFDPEYPEPEEPANERAPRLHIPHKDYAIKAQATQYDGHALQQYTANWLAVERWAGELRCSGVDGSDTLTPTNEPWKETRLHIPHKEVLTARNINDNYLAFERWARLICPHVHIPHKEWFATAKDGRQEQVNLLTIERWAREIGRCCERVGGGGG